MVFIEIHKNNANFRLTDDLVKRCVVHRKANITAIAGKFAYRNIDNEGVVCERLGAVFDSKIGNHKT